MKRILLVVVNVVPCSSRIPRSILQATLCSKSELLHSELLSDTNNGLLGEVVGMMICRLHGWTLSFP